ncbi:YutD family protein [Lapidilactobacillus salsurivasis]
MNTDEIGLAPLTGQPQIYNLKHDEDPDYRGVSVKVLDPENLEIGSRRYQLLANYRDGFEPERLGQRFEPILGKYDYIVGDWGFDQLRLRGFYVDENRNANRDQVISSLEDYLIEFCNFGCAFFVIQRVGPSTVTTEREARRRQRPRNSNNNAENGKGKKRPAFSSNTRGGSANNKSERRRNNRRGDTPRGAGPRAEVNNETAAAVNAPAGTAPTGRRSRSDEGNGRTSEKRRPRSRGNSGKNKAQGDHHNKPSAQPQSNGATSSKRSNQPTTAAKTPSQPQQHRFHIRNLDQPPK